MDTKLYSHNSIQRIMPVEAKLCWYIDEKERTAALLERRQFNPYFNTSEYFHIAEHGVNYIGGS